MIARPPAHALIGLPHRQQHLLESDALLQMRKLEPCKPAHVRFGPSPLASMAQLVPQQLVLVAPAVSRFETGEVPAGTLVIHGELDDVVPLQAVLDWARPQDLPVVVVPGGEHFFHGRLPVLQQIVTRYCRP